MQHKCIQRCLGLENYRTKRDAPKCNFWFQMLRFRTPWASLGQIGTDWARFSQIGRDWARLGQIVRILCQIGLDWLRYHLGSKITLQSTTRRPSGRSGPKVTRKAQIWYINRPLFGRPDFPWCWLAPGALPVPSFLPLPWHPPLDVITGTMVSKFHYILVNILTAFIYTLICSFAIRNSQWSSTYMSVDWLPSKKWPACFRRFNTVWLDT